MISTVIAAVPGVWEEVVTSSSVCHLLHLSIIMKHPSLHDGNTRLTRGVVWRRHEPGAEKLCASSLPRHVWHCTSTLPQALGERLTVAVHTHALWLPSIRRPDTLRALSVFGAPAEQAANCSAAPQAFLHGCPLRTLSSCCCRALTPSVPRPSRPPRCCPRCRPKSCRPPWPPSQPPSPPACASRAR